MSPDFAAQLEAWIATRVRDEVARQLADVRVPREYLSTREAADLANVAQATIRRWVREGRLKASGAGREIRIQRVELETLMRPDGRRLPPRPTRAPRTLSPEEQAEKDLGLR